MMQKSGNKKNISEIKIKKYKANIRENICFLKENGLFNIQENQFNNLKMNLKNKGY